MNRAPQTTLKWADTVASWNFRQVIPCHFAAPVVATPAEFRRAFDFLLANSPHQLPEADLATLKNIDALLYKPGIVPPPQLPIGK